MKPIYNRHGQLVAWLNRTYLHDLSGAQLWLFIGDGAVFTYKGRHVGGFTNGYFRDKDGHAIAFTKDASIGPPLPVVMYPPIPPNPVFPKFPALALVPPLPPIDRFTWSKISWEEFIPVEGRQMQEALGIFSP
jgi:hypothetical protein